MFFGVIFILQVKNLLQEQVIVRDKFLCCYHFSALLAVMATNDDCGLLPSTLFWKFILSFYSFKVLKNFAMFFFFFSSVGESGVSILWLKTTEFIFFHFDMAFEKKKHDVFLMLEIRLYHMNWEW